MGLTIAPPPNITNGYAVIGGGGVMATRPAFNIRVVGW